MAALTSTMRGKDLAARREITRLGEFGLDVLALMKKYMVVYIAACAVKLLVLPAYRSTDFEVHRNWMAITDGLPVREWYFDATSPWTMDYPPMFAYFEWSCAQFAKAWAPDAVKLSATPVETNSIVIFQRLSVIITESILFIGTCALLASDATSVHHHPTSSRGRKPSGGTTNHLTPHAARLVVLLLTHFHAGLFFVDNIHFQYNGMLVGLLYVSIALMTAELPVSSCLVFAVLLLLKHLFVFMAPVVAAYVISTHLLHAPDLAAGVKTVALCVALPLMLAAITFAPFLLTAESVLGFVRQLVSRLFPFERGLVHSYWAPNAWAAYLTVDKAAVYVVRKLGWDVSASTPLAVLPTITPFASAAIVLVFIGIICIAILRRSTSNFLVCAVASYFVAFMFGWHTHEKAILYALMPLLSSWSEHTRIGWPLWTGTVASVLCIFPLIFHPKEQLIVVSCATAFTYFVLVATKIPVPKHVLLACTAAVFAILLVYYLHMAFIPSLPFAHLMLSSLACFAGLLPLFCKVFTLAVWDELE